MTRISALKQIVEEIHHTPVRATRETNAKIQHLKVVVNGLFQGNFSPSANRLFDEARRIVMCRKPRISYR